MSLYDAGRHEVRDEDSDRQFLIALIALVVVMDLAESVFWLLASSWRFARRGSRRLVPVDPRSSASEDIGPAVSIAR